ncbi:MAG: ATP-dependent DNA ligase [Actinomycetales bacterium]|nr:ATP-dependent DNA ligase [Candidatus Lutibacillus vidarii]
MSTTADHAPTALSALIETADAVAATSSRKAKIDALAGLLRTLGPAEIEPAVGILTGELRQGSLGVGWAAVSAADAAPAEVATLTILEVDEALTRLVDASGSGSAAVRAAELDGVWRRATSAEQAFLARVILSGLRIGALAGVMVDAVAAASGVAVPTVRRAVMLSGSLGGTAVLALTSGAEAVAAVGLRVGIPVFPMLAATAPSAGAAVTTLGRASVEYKLDGARIQVHRSGGPGSPVRVFTRTLAEITTRVPELVAVVDGFPGGALILDGETLALTEDGAPRPFQETMSRFGSTSGRDEVLRPWFFDVLHADGVDLVDEPLQRRREVLRTVAGAHVVPSLETDSPAAADELGRAALAAGHEGVVVKDLASAYAAGRRGSSWLKVKPVHTVDLVVLAAEWGSGRRTGWLSNLHLGARDPAVPLGEPGAFVMVGKTFKGLTDELLRWQTARFLELETGRSGYAVQVAPELVVEIALDGVQRSRRYPGGVALRFARVKAYRADKAPADADTIGTLQAMLKG